MRLDIAMSDAVLVAEMKGRDKLVEIKPGCRFRKPAATAIQLAKKLTAVSQLHNKVDFGFRSHDFMEFEDIRVVIQTAHGGDFTDYSRFHGSINGGSGFVNNFNSNFTVIIQSTAMVHFSKATPTQKTIQFILSKNDRSRSTTIGAGGSSDFDGGWGRLWVFYIHAGDVDGGRRGKLQEEEETAAKARDRARRKRE